MRSKIIKAFSFISYFLALCSIAYFAFTGFFCNFIYSGTGLLVLSAVCIIFILLASYSNYKVSLIGSKRAVVYLALALCLAVYLVDLAIMLFGFRFSFDGVSELDLILYAKSNTNFRPLHSIAWYIHSHSFSPVIGHVLLLFPLGFMLPMLCKKAKKLLIFSSILLAFCVLIEIMQLITKLGSFDVDDIILDFLGSLLGYKLSISTKAYLLVENLTYPTIQPLEEKRKGIRS